MKPRRKTSLPPAPLAAPQPTRSKRWRLAVAVYAAAVFLVSVVPIDAKVSVSHLDKVVHLCQYLVFAWLLVQAVRASGMPEREYLWMAWIYATSYGLLIEMIQAMLPWRSAEAADIVANALGAWLGAFVGEKTPRQR